MENNRRNLITAIVDLAAGILFVVAAVRQSQTIPRVMFTAAAVCLLISGIVLVILYLKTQKTNDK